MAVISTNRRGNPYHDEETGRFTTAGFGAIVGEIENDSENPRASRLNEMILNSPGNTALQKYLYFINHSQMRDFNFLMDTQFAIPLLTRHFDLAKSFGRYKVKENHNELLDAVGVDFIAYNGNNPGFLNNEGLFSKLDLIDVKTTFTDSVKMNIFQLIGSRQDLFRDVISNPHLKGNNYYVMSFIDAGLSEGESIRHFMGEVVTKSFQTNGKTQDFPIEAYKVHKNRLMKAISERVNVAGFNDRAEEIDKDLSEMPYDVFVDKYLKNYSSPKHLGNGIFQYTKDLGNGIDVCVTMTPEEFRYGFRMFLSLHKSFFDKVFVNNKLTRK